MLIINIHTSLATCREDGECMGGGGGRGGGRERDNCVVVDKMDKGTPVVIFSFIVT